MAVDTPWVDLMKSVVARRSRDAPFFKPACLIAVIDLIGMGRLDPTDIDADQVVEHMNTLVDGIHMGRRDMRWRPIWHLSNDGAWTFTKAGRRIGPQDFQPARKPDSLRQWRESFDRVTVPPTMLEYWKSEADRTTLRRAALAMLEDGNEACRRLASRLRSGPSDRGAQLAHGATSGRQGFLADAAIRRAVERHAMDLATEWLEAEGWTVTDRSASESYDLLAELGANRLFVEVKGTTGIGDVIQLTRLEVEFARTNRDLMALIVVAQIIVAVAGEGAVVSGGELIIRRPWAPSHAALQPISFTCHLE
ncbi:DUF3883 domain-containing protein [Mesorhizobium sp. M0228]|uniref:protein NO VEIN domain-containing protein n=1 Tax=Mesorhizobium sp. M0228 TaxID=2956923 RepID=UPI0033364675